MKEHVIFQSNPTLKEVHITSDGEAFYNDTDAKAHAKTLKDKLVKLVVNPLLIDTIVDDEEQDDFDDTDHFHTAPGFGQPIFGILAKADGSENVLMQSTTEGSNLGPLDVLTIAETQEAITSGGEVITPKVETPEVEAPQVEAPEVETQKVEAPVVEAPKVKVPKSQPKKSK